MNEVQMIADIWETAQVENRPTTIKVFKERMLELIRNKGEMCSQTLLHGLPDANLERLVEDVKRVFSMKQEEFAYSGRYIQVVYPRHIFHKVAVDHRISTLRHIGKYSGCKDHTTVMSSKKRANNLLTVKDPVWMQYWTKFLNEGDPYFTNLYNKQKDA